MLSRRHPRQPWSSSIRSIPSAPRASRHPLRCFPGCKLPPAVPVEVSSHLRTTSFSSGFSKKKKNKEAKQNFFFFLLTGKKKVLKCRGSVLGVNGASSLARCAENPLSLLRHLFHLLPHMKRGGLSEASFLHTAYIFK